MKNINKKPAVRIQVALNVCGGWGERRRIQIGGLNALRKRAHTKTISVKVTF